MEAGSGVVAGERLLKIDARLGTITPQLVFGQSQFLTEEKWCPEADSNHRHADFQSAALPTELSGHPAAGAAFSDFLGVTPSEASALYHLVRRWQAPIKTFFAMARNKGNFLCHDRGLGGREWW